MIPELYNRFLPVIHHGDMSADGTTRGIARPPRRGLRQRWAAVGLASAAGAAGIFLITLVAPSTAGAHPFDARFYSHRIVVEARPGTLGVVVSMEIPAAIVMREFAGVYSDRDEVGEEQDREFAQRIFQRMGSQLRVLVSGENREMDWQPIPDVPNGVGNGRFFVYHLQATTPVTWGAEPTEVLITNDNEIDRPAYYSGWIFAEEGVYAMSSSLTGIGADAAAADAFEKAGAWSADPVNRDVSVAFRLGPPPDPAATQPAGDVENEIPDGEGTGSGGFPWWIVFIPIPPAIVLYLQRRRR